jgi:hypothetical protein
MEQPIENQSTFVAVIQTSPTTLNPVHKYTPEGPTPSGEGRAKIGDGPSAVGPRAPRISARKGIDPAKVARQKEAAIRAHVENVISGATSKREFADESTLTSLIESLWSAKGFRGTLASRSRREAERLRVELSVQLHAYKEQLVGTGRDGTWAPFLKQIGIPRATADRYVKDHIRKLAGSDKLLSEELVDASGHEITAMVKRLKPRLAAKLRTTDSVQTFLSELAAALQAGERA